MFGFTLFFPRPGGVFLFCLRSAESSRSAIGGENLGLPDPWSSAVLDGCVKIRLGIEAL
jgi:hypothetical protein